MGNPELSIRIPEPKDEFRKTRFGVMPEGMNQDIGFTNFRLAQKLDANGKKLGRASYGVNLENKTGNEKQDELLIYLTQYISDLELGPVEIDDNGRFIFDKDINIEKRKQILEKIIKPCIAFFNKVEGRFKEFKDIRYFSIDKGVLSLGVIIPPHRDIQVININLSSVFTKNALGEFLLDGEKMDQELRWRVKEDLSKLRESLETESYFGGMLIVSYQEKEGAKKALGGALGGLSLAGGVSTTEYLVRKMLFRNENGKMQEVDPKIVRSILKGVGDKTRINSLLFKVMKAAGRSYNPLRSAFTDVTTLGIDRATEKIKNLKRADIEQGRTMTDTEFEAEKAKMIGELAKMPRSAILAKSAEFLKGIPVKTMHYIFWGVFFAEYQKNTYDLANMYKGFAETGLFYAGANLGGRVTPGIWKMPGSLLGGGLAVLGGHAAGGAMNLDKKVWRMMPERVAGNGEKSIEGHIFFGGASNDLADRGDTDLGIPGTRGGAALYNPFGKDGIMPNVDFAGTNITFGTNPRAYLQSRVSGTDVHWNKRMDEYVSWATHMTMKILQEYDNNRGYFASSNGNKDELLRERLRHVFDSEDGKNVRNRQIIDDCIDYAITKLTKIKDLNSRKELLSIFLGNYANILKIDEASLKYDESLLERDKSILDNQSQMYLALLTPEKREFAEKVFARLEKGGILIDGKVTTHRGELLGQEVGVFRPDAKDLALYQSLFDDTTPAKSEWFDLLGYKESQIDYKSSSFNIPDKIITLGGKNVYFRSYFDILISEYDDALKGKNGINIMALDEQYGLDIMSQLTSRKTRPSSITLRAILLENIVKKDPEAHRLLVEKNYQKLPTQGDILVYLLNIHTEYREQKRFIENQKSIGYANKWKLF